MSHQPSEDAKELTADSCSLQHSLLGHESSVHIEDFDEEACESQNYGRKRTPKTADFRSSRRKLIALTLPHIKWLIWGCIVLLIRLPFSLSMPHWVASTIGALVSHEGKHVVLKYIFILFCCGTIDSILDFWCVFLFSYAKQRIIRDLRLRLFSAILQQEVGFFDSVKSGDLNSRLNADCGIMANDLTSVFRFTIEALVRIAGISGYMFYFEPKLALLTVRFDY